ncbi:lysozyme [Bradyrhizobium sp. SZCCHNRI3037]|uniref:lysozyme n=1 Tax=Bradyrhizobium sp. SZCCHNRI3037 TaxID=3057290 RepID=UPI0029168F8A|nr:lysozyme [Bradyrhizobium sp. SZCCHNRI3037]
MRTYSAAARQRVTELWEECVLYVYDDKVPKRRIDGRLRYPEWDGGAPIGTLSIGFGPTDAAGGLKISHGLRLTHAEADELLSRDLALCERAVNAALKVRVTQHQFDALVDTYFNCPTAALAAIRLINAGKAEQVPAKLLQYVYSNGDYMKGDGFPRRAKLSIAVCELSLRHVPPIQTVALLEERLAPRAEKARDEAAELGPNAHCERLLEQARKSSLPPSSPEY